MNNSFFLWAQKCAKSVGKIVPEYIRYDIKEKLIEKSIREFVASRACYDSTIFPKGVNLIGNISAEMGLGQSCRLVARELEASKFNFSVYNVGFNGKLRENDKTYEKFTSLELPYGINLFHVNPCEIGQVFMTKPQIWNQRYNIAFWLWELEEFPDEWVKYCALFDEIWTPSKFAGNGIRKKTKVPVRTLPYSVIAPIDEEITRETFGLPNDKFLYLVMFDSNSTMERKNPMGAIQAYKKAYKKENPKCGLVIKINNANNEDVNVLKKEMSEYKNVYFLTDILEKRQVNSLIKCVDVLISLHRAEGFGLVMAEAMLLGTPVVATNWSSNTEFMTKEAACMVDYTLVPNKVEVGPYKVGSVWAEPNIEEAAEYLLKLYEDDNFYKMKSEQGKKCIDEKLNEEHIASLWNYSLERIP